MHPDYNRWRALPISDEIQGHPDANRGADGEVKHYFDVHLGERSAIERLVLNGVDAEENGLVVREQLDTNDYRFHVTARPLPMGSWFVVVTTCDGDGVRSQTFGSLVEKPAV